MKGAAEIKNGKGCLGMDMYFGKGKDQKKKKRKKKEKNRKEKEKKPAWSML